MPQGALLNLGCGPFPLPGFYNVDYWWIEGVDLCCDLTKPMPIASCTAGGAFTEHFFEHIPFEAGVRFLRDLYCVLQPGAPVRISVPDAEIYIRHYIDGTPFPWVETDAKSIGYTPMMSVNRIFYRDHHCFIYDFATLSLALEKSGFVDIRKERFGSGRDSRLLVDQEVRAVESLYVEASKPGGA